MSTTIAHSDVRNLCYQMLAQFRELYKSAPAEAMLRYNYDSRDADKLVKMSHEELLKWADRGRLCFSLELPTTTERVLHAAHSDLKNFFYQMLAQFRELYKSSPAEAMLRYNYDSRDADQLVKMSHEELLKWADRGRLCFSLDLPSTTERVLHAV